MQDNHNFSLRSTSRLHFKVLISFQSHVCQWGRTCELDGCSHRRRRPGAISADASTGGRGRQLLLKQRLSLHTTDAMPGCMQFTCPMPRPGPGEQYLAVVGEEAPCVALALPKKMLCPEGRGRVMQAR